MSEPYKLYGAEFSLYTGKVRSYLRKKGIPFEEILSTSKVYTNFIEPRTGVRYIPVLQTPNNEVIQDTTTILDRLERDFRSPSIYPATPMQKLVSLLLETYGDEWLVIPAMHYRWNFPDDNEPFIYEEFGTIVSTALPAFMRARLGKKLAGRFRGALPYLGISADTVPGIEASYTALLADLNAHFSQHDYLLGSRPCVADFSFIGPFYAHLYRDPYPGNLMRDTAPAVADWVERMMSEEPANGALLGADEIPETLLPVLRRMAQEQVPVLLETDAKLSEWRDSNDDGRIPRSIGSHSFQVEGAEGTRAIFPYALWMFKRPVDFYQSLPLDVRAKLDDLLQPLGFADVLEQGLQNRLVRPDNVLQFAV